ncbi:uncharacterized protein LOC130691120 [Daphnia carinata]|uniref:uncharacterized protein LOC130691120 n=1 Tax=Daphnia carinata TaxID=120202 RepID=UPI00257A764B|nr:uncharacterized protein LOC130691120 [Daphnia carinata]
MKLRCGPTKVAVVTKEGRFDLKNTEFWCSECKQSRLATNEEYMCSGYWPGSLSNCSYFFEENLLRMWHRLRHKTPGTSERKFIETLEEISLDCNRVNIINRTLFNRARREFEYFTYLKEKEILRRHGNCKICGNHPHGMHADANRKLYRYASAKDRQGESLYGDVKMASDQLQLEHISKIEEKIPKGKGDDACGSSTWKAARGDSSSKRNLDITGLEMMSCSHGTVIFSANLFKGETFKHTHLQHLKSHQMGTKFLCNDVVCKYWPFATKESNLFGESNPEYKKLTEDMVPFLSRFHGLGHSWACRVLYNGHWQKDGADMLEEEQEQVFSYMARLGTTTKHQSRASRRDDITSAILAYNVDKEKRMMAALCLRLNRARRKSNFYGKKLQDLLDHRGLKEELLPQILIRLKNQAKLVKSKNLNSDWDVELLQKEIEGECHMIKVLHTRNATFFDTCKTRTSNRKIMSKKKKRVDTIVKLLQQKGIIVSKENTDTGFFPWHQNNKNFLGKDYELIDTWMLGLRYQEAITKTQREMGEFTRSLTSLCKDLHRDIKNYERLRPTTLLDYSRSVMANTEIVRLSGIISDAVHVFTEALQFREDIEINPQAFIDRIEKEDNLLDSLQEASGDDYYTDSGEESSEEEGEN